MKDFFSVVSNPLYKFYNFYYESFDSFNKFGIIFQITFAFVFWFFFFILTTIIFYYFFLLIDKFIIKKYVSEKIKTFMLNNNHNPHVKYINIFYNYVINNYKDIEFCLCFILFIGPLSILLMLVLIHNNIKFEEYFKFVFRSILFFGIYSIPVVGYFILLYIFYNLINKKILIK
jgi:hypothetical protein